MKDSVILNVVKNLAKSLAKFQREILRDAQDDINGIILLEKLKLSIVNYFTIPFSRYSTRLVRMLSPARSTATLAISASTIIFTSSSKVVF